MCFSASDDTLAPPGQHVVTIWGQWYPYALADGADWDALAETEAQRLVDAVDRFAPGFADSVQRLYVQTPLALERELSLPRGNVMHVEMGLASMFAFRPTPALSGYRVPGLPGLYLAGASTHPGGGVSGNSGRTAARVLLADRARPRAPAPRRAGRCAGAAPAARGRRDATAVDRRGPVRALRPPPRLAAAAARRSLLVLPRSPIRSPTATAATRSAGRSSCSAPALSVVHAGAQPRRADGPRRPAARRRRPPWRSRRSGWPPASRTAATPTATPSGPTLLGVPFLVPLAWLMMAWPSWVLADRLARPVRPAGARSVRIAVAAAVFAAWDVVLDPQMVAGRLLDVGAPAPGPARASTPCR